MSSSLGAVKGWWTATYLLSLGLYLRSGKSTTQRNSSFSLLTSERISPSLSLTFDITWFTVSTESAPKNTMSPFSIERASAKSPHSSSLRNLTMGELHPSSPTLIHASPFAPSEIAYSVRSSISFLVSFSAPPLRLSAFIVPPFSTAPRNTLNSESLNMEEMFFSSRPNLVSGQSVPYLSMASS